MRLTLVGTDDSQRGFTESFAKTVCEDFDSVTLVTDSPQSRYAFVQNNRSNITIISISEALELSTPLPVYSAAVIFDKSLIVDEILSYSSFAIDISTTPQLEELSKLLDRRNPSTMSGVEMFQILNAFGILEPDGSLSESIRLSLLTHFEANPDSHRIWTGLALFGKSLGLGFFCDYANGCLHFNSIHCKTLLSFRFPSVENFYFLFSPTKLSDFSALLSFDLRSRLHLENIPSWTNLSKSDVLKYLKVAKPQMTFIFTSTLSLKQSPLFSAAGDEHSNLRISLIDYSSKESLVEYLKSSESLVTVVFHDLPDLNFFKDSLLQENFHIHIHQQLFFRRQGLTQFFHEWLLHNILLRLAPFQDRCKFLFTEDFSSILKSSVKLIPSDFINLPRVQTVPRPLRNIKLSKI
jgi:hypothetical protein